MRERERVCVCVSRFFVSVCERERERERVCVCVSRFFVSVCVCLQSVKHT